MVNNSGAQSRMHARQCSVRCTHGAVSTGGGRARGGPAGKVNALRIVSNMCEISAILVSAWVRLGKSESSRAIVSWGDDCGFRGVSAVL